MSLYMVIGHHDYREHKPGETFEAFLDPDAEQRAVARGNIIVLDSSPTRLRPGTFTPPDGWHIPNHPDQAAQAASFIEGSNT